eukprot:scaffold38244_cov30-Tisochrysis_lutea.AAC.7
MGSARVMRRCSGLAQATDLLILVDQRTVASRILKREAKRIPMCADTGTPKAWAQRASGLRQVPEEHLPPNNDSHYFYPSKVAASSDDQHCQAYHGTWEVFLGAHKHRHQAGEPGRVPRGKEVAESDRASARPNADPVLVQVFGKPAAERAWASERRPPCSVEIG